MYNHSSADTSALSCREKNDINSLADETLLKILSSFLRLTGNDYAALTKLSYLSKRFSTLIKDNRLWCHLFPYSVMKKVQVSRGQWFQRAVAMEVDANFVHYGRYRGFIKVTSPRTQEADRVELLKLNDLKGNPDTISYLALPKP